MLPRYKRQFGLFCGAGVLWSLNINQYTDNIHEIPPYSMHLGLVICICTMDITIQYKQPTVQFDLLACSTCVDFACFYMEFAFRHYAKKVGSLNKKKRLLVNIFLLILRKILSRPGLGWWKPQIVGSAKLIQVEFSLNRGCGCHRFGRGYRFLCFGACAPRCLCTVVHVSCDIGAVVVVNLGFYNPKISKQHPACILKLAQEKT